MFKKVLLFAMVFYTILGFIIIPFFAKSQIIKIVEKQTNTKLAIDSIWFNPFTFIIRLSDVKLKDLDNKNIVSFKFLEINLEPHQLINKTINIKRIELSKPKLYVQFYKDKTFNFSKLLKQSNNTKQITKEESELPRIILEKLKIDDGNIYYEDFSKSKKFSFNIDAISFKIQDIDTNNFDMSDAYIKIHSRLSDNGIVDLKTKILGFKPLKLSGNIKFTNTKLYTIWKYLKDDMPVEIADGVFNLNAPFNIDLDNLNSMSIDNAKLSLNKLRITPIGKPNDLLNLKSINIDGINIKPFKQEVYIDKINSQALDINVIKNKKAQIDWLTYLKSKDTNNKITNENSTNQKPWNVTLAKVDLNTISLDFNDDFIHPKVKTSLNELNIHIKDFNLDSKKPFNFEMDLQLNDMFTCNSNGSIIQKNLSINGYLKCQGFDITHYLTYIDKIANENLKIYNVRLTKANVDFDANINLKSKNNSFVTNINNANFILNKLVLKDKRNSKKIFNFNSFKINNINLDTSTKAINISKISLNTPSFNVTKFKDNTTNLDGLIELKTTKKPKTTKEKSYRIKVKKIALNSARVNFNDKSIDKEVKINLDKINLKASNIDSKKGSKIDYDLSIRVNKSGNIKSKGLLSHSPISQNSTLKINKISLKDFSPYISQNMYVKIDDGYVSIDSKMSYQETKNKPDLKLDGELLIEEFFLSDTRNQDSILSFIKLNLKSFNLEMFPSNLYVDKVDLDSFYIDARIDENKVMNLAKLSKQNTIALDDNKTSKTKEAPFPYRIMTINVSNGSANFSDASIPIYFKTDIHDLNGAIYAISSYPDEISYLDIDGEVDKYASTKLVGSIETSNIKSYLDLDFTFRNLALNSLSGYSAEFAGYKIDSGKLYLDLGYKIFNSQLLGKNNIMIKKIKLGNEIEDDNISKLPLGFAIALLEDGDGVIDIDMPVEGNLDEPDFKYGALVLKTFVNLIIKAVASPFKLLGSALGIDGDELEFAEFEAADIKILPSEREKLDNVAKILLKKPKLAFTITGTYDENVDRLGIATIKLVKEVTKLSGERTNKSDMTIEILEYIFKKNVSQKELDLLKEKIKKNTIKKIFNINYQKELVKKCKEFQRVSKEELITLANTRAKNLRDYLINVKMIKEDRVIIKESIKTDDSKDKYVKSIFKIEVK